MTGLHATNLGTRPGLRSRWVAHGEEAIAALEESIVAAQSRDALAPVTVVTPSPAVAVTIRREILRRRGGIVGVQFSDLGGLAENLAASELAARGIDVGVDRELVTTAVRLALGRRDGRFSPIAHHRTTWEVVASAITELASLSPDVRASLATDARDRHGSIVAELLSLHDAVAGDVPLGSGAIALRLAASLVDGGVDLGEVGPVIVHLPSTMAPPERALLDALARRGSVEVLLGSAGRPEDDAELARSSATFGVGPPDVPVDQRPATGVVSANDIDDEVRSAVRRLLAAAESGTPWHRMALVHPTGGPYDRIVAEVLTDCAIPYAGPSVGRLSQSAAGRVLLGVLEVAASGFGRQQVVDLWSSGVILDGDQRLLPFAQLDLSSQSMGIVGGGHEVWRGAIERERRRLGEGPSDGPAPATGDGSASGSVGARQAIVDTMSGAIETLVGLVGENEPLRWGEVAAWAEQVLDVLCGPPTSRLSWPDHELDADTAIRASLGRLAALSQVEPEPARDIIRATIRTTLEAPAPRRAPLGRGLFVTTLDAPPLVPLDMVAVVGLVEGLAPRRVADDVLLGEALRAEVGLATAASDARHQRRSFDAALASCAGERLVFFARNDQRSGRAQVPSRWLIDAVRSISGTRPDTEDVMAGVDLAGIELVPSLEGSLRAVAASTAGVAALHADERLLADITQTGSLDDHPARGSDAIAASLDLLRARRSNAFTRYDGNVTGHGVDVTAVGALSPTSLETYASCPRRWFFGHVLGVGRVDRPEEIDRLQPMTRGTLVHRVLERFFEAEMAAGLVPPPGARWSEASHRSLLDIADEECERLERRGLTGHPRWWAHDRAEIDQVLRQMLDADEGIRAQMGLEPAFVELTFGRDAAPPLQIDLPDGRTISLAGQIDRVDVGAGGAAVWDYKHASPSNYSMIEGDGEGKDRLGFGKRLQLVAYALAAQNRTGVDRVWAHYWFVKPGSAGRVIGYEVDDELRDRFHNVVDVIVAGIGEGRFPGRPGPHKYHLSDHEECAYCDFTKICPGDRADAWERVRFDPSLRSYDQLLTEGSAASESDEGIA